MGNWSVKLDFIQEWLDAQDIKTVARVMDAVEKLGAEGPALGRPLVDTVKYSRFSNMKELRPASPGSSEIRILFAFDPSRKAVMLFAGDKSQGGSRYKWARWYAKAVPASDRLYESYLKELSSDE